MACARRYSSVSRAHTRPDGSRGWYLTSKSRWTDASGGPAGIVTVSVDLRTPVDAAAPHRQLAAVVDTARRRFAETLTVAELADAGGMTVAQLERTTRRILGLSPKQLVMRFRLEEALRLLDTTDLPLATIASACGDDDPSAFTRHFRRVVGRAPAAWRSLTAGPRAQGWSS